LDRALSADLAELSLRYCKRGELTMFPDATHWLQHEEQESVSRALAEFFLGLGRWLMAVHNGSDVLKQALSL
jgi:pimeloyl-ACP methyl ester carboxylesterase